MIGVWTMMACHAGLCTPFALSATRQWRRARGGGTAAVEAAELDELELAMLNGGPELAIASAAARLRPNLVARPGRGPRTFAARGQPGADAPQLVREVFRAVRDAEGISAQDLLRRLGDSEAVAEISGRLTQAGLLQNGRTVTRLRRLAVAGAVLAMAGAGVALAGSDEGEPVAVALAVAMTAAVGGAALWLARAGTRATARGRAVLARRREQRDDLRGTAHPAELGLAVALFGGSALWAADAGFAAAWGDLSAPGVWWSGGHYGVGGCGDGGCGGGCGGCG